MLHGWLSRIWSNFRYSKGIHLVQIWEFQITLCNLRPWVCIPIPRLHSRDLQLACNNYNYTLDTYQREQHKVAGTDQIKLFVVHLISLEHLMKEICTQRLYSSFVNMALLISQKSHAELYPWFSGWIFRNFLANAPSYYLWISPQFKTMIYMSMGEGFSSWAKVHITRLVLDPN